MSGAWRSDARERRQVAERAGRFAEFLAAGYLIATGHRILARRFRCGVGEIDLIAVRGRRLAFVEVKQRRNGADMEISVTGRQAQRIRAASEVWVQRFPRYGERVFGYDRCDVIGRWRVRYHRDVLQPLR